MNKPQSTRPRCFALAIAVTFVAVAVACSSPSSLEVADDDPGEISDDGVVPLEAALAAYVRAFGPLPGIDAQGPDPLPRRSGTGPLCWVWSHWQELTDDQRAVVMSRMNSWTDEIEVPTSDPLPGAMFQQQAAYSSADLRAMAARIVVDFSRRLGRSLSATIVLNMATGGDPNVPAYTSPFNSSGQSPFGACEGTCAVGKPPYGRMTKCQITLNPSAQAFDGDDPSLRATLSHEIFHCFMADFIGIDAFVALPPWLREGAAAWVGESAVSGTYWSRGWWARYLTLPERSLFKRDYDAIGFYSLLDAHGTSPWSLFDKMAGAGGNDGAYTIAIKAADPNLLGSWAASYMRDPSLGEDWDATGPGITNARGPIATQSVGNGEIAKIEANPLAVNIGIIDVTSDVMTIDLSPSGDSRVYGLLHDPLGVTSPLLSGVYCVRPDGCVCPRGTPGEGTAFYPQYPGRFHVAVAGHLRGERVDIHGYTLDDFCKTPDRKSSVSLSGAVNKLITQRGTCSSLLGTYAANFEWIDPSTGALVDFNLGVALGYHGPGTYFIDLDNHVTSVSLTGPWSPGLFALGVDEPGYFTVSDDEQSGSVSAVMRDMVHGSTIVVAMGQWVCDRIL